MLHIPRVAYVTIFHVLSMYGAVEVTVLHPLGVKHVGCPIFVFQNADSQSLRSWKGMPQPAFLAKRRDTAGLIEGVRWRVALDQQMCAWLVLDI